MELSQSALAQLYLYALLLGIFLGAVYDVLRLTRVFLGVHYSCKAAKRLQAIQLPLLKTKKRRKESRALGFVIFIEDLLFCIFAGIALVLLFYEANSGKLRFPVLLCAGAGFLLYRGTLGRAVMLFSEVIAFIVETTVRYALFFLVFPIRSLVGLLCRLTTSCVRHLARIQQKKKRLRYTVSERQRTVQNACGLLAQNLPRNKQIKGGKKVGRNE